MIQQPTNDMGVVSRSGASKYKRLLVAIQLLLWLCSFTNHSPVGRLTERWEPMVSVGKSSTSGRIPHLRWFTKGFEHVPSGKDTKPFFIGKLTISMAIFNSKLLVIPEGTAILQTSFQSCLPLTQVTCSGWCEDWCLFLSDVRSWDSGKDTGKWW